ncbi:RNA polymerase sigma factor [Pseudomonas sp. WS 5011]|nr:RNA polymerase sigma factor [Pseudomonas sp. WS 5011]NMY51262.1 RNA polymerase sigma factor [Pseudomonas sp. WS 5011]
MRIILDLFPISHCEVRVSAGDSTHQQVVGLFYRDHRDWLLGWLRKSLYSPERAEDLSQDTFVRLLGRSDLDQAREPRALLTTIAKGLLIDHFRRSALERTYLEELGQQPQDVQPSAEEQALALDALREIDRLLGELSSNARAAFLHNRLDGMGHAEIAERLGVSVSRVRQYLAQGLRQCYIALYGEPQ